MPVELRPEHLAIPQALARKLCRGDCHLAEEMEGEAGLALVLAARAFDPKKAPEGEAGKGPWLCREVRWRLLRFLRGLRASRKKERTAGKAWLLAASLARPAVEDREWAEAALARMPPLAAALFRLRAWEGLETWQAAERLGVDPFVACDACSLAAERERRAV